MKTLTTGEIAKICDVNLRTVIRWIERGDLKGFKLPGRGNNRVLVEDFVAFLESHNMPVPPEYAPKSNNRVLVLDDEPAITRLISRILRTAGYSVDVATDGFQGGAKLLQDRPYLITLDLSMPGLDGFQVLDFIRSTEEIKHTKVVVVSALSTSELNRALDAGADAVLQKPFKNQELTDMVAQLSHAE
ncbi:response regulator [Marinobacterium sp. AK62]|uniref:Response regulator n=1 Tax=Marinobacterium alkalitolerans TaxID=1542925 RepID=A0ABS3Z6U2_9GAMM|nr:response regulator [Marinobacterium alkalitolerans]MBP0047409.1 response regulator [Marinobacterium alkalitolerans]